MSVPATAPASAEQVFKTLMEEVPSFVDMESFTRVWPKPGANTAVTYMYCDAGNNKKRETYVYSGAITPHQIRLIAESVMTVDGEHDFLPRQVGLAPLCPFFDDDDYDDDLDHCFHTIDCISLVSDPADCDPVDDLVKRFVEVGPQGWDIQKFGN
jgi:hypothetical protein